jgi:undecaprenyl-diphosphatase
MNLIELLNIWDTNLFLLINGFHNPFFDGVMFAISEKITWIPLYLSVLYIVIKRWNRDSVWVIIALILCIVIADQVSSGLIKHLVERPRPSHVESLSGLIHLVNDYRGGNYGFVSSHAANSFGFALLSSLLFRRNKYTIAIFIWALLNSYSRIYLGVHYPFDILGGAIVGVLAAIICFQTLKRMRPSLFYPHNNYSTIDNPKTIIPVYALGITLLGIIIYSIVVF